VKVGLFQNSRQILPRLWRGRGKYTLETSTSTYPEFFMNVTCAEPHKITRKELSAPEIQYNDKPKGTYFNLCKFTVVFYTQTVI
jgi:hypothetical protein